MIRFIRATTCLLFLFLTGCAVTVEDTSLDFGSTETIKTLHINVKGRVGWSLYCEDEWVRFGPEEGSTTEEITVRVDRTGMEPDDYYTELEILTKGNIKAPTIEVLMSVGDTGTTTTTTTTDSSTTTTVTGSNAGQWDSAIWDQDVWGE